MNDEKCPGCGARVESCMEWWAEYRYGRTFDFEESVDCLRRQLAQAKEQIAKLRDGLLEVSFRIHRKKHTAWPHPERTHDWILKIINRALSDTEPPT